VTRAVIVVVAIPRASSVLASALATSAGVCGS
jgi:hypothetical protein